MSSATDKEISCRVTRTLLLYVRETNEGSLGPLLDGLELGEDYLSDTNNWVSHAFLQLLYHRMVDILGDENAVYRMTLASERFQSLGILDRIVRLLGNPKLIYSQAPRYNKLLKLNGDVHIHEQGDSWVLLEDRYHNSAQKTRYDCDYTRGILAGIPTMFDMPLAHVEEIECQVAPEVYGNRVWEDNPKQGSKGCLYRVKWDNRQRPPFWKRMFFRHDVYLKAIEDLQDANRRIQEKYHEARELATFLETANSQLIQSKQELESGAADLKASEGRYRLLAENVSDIIWTLNLETLRFTYISPSVRRVRGFTPEEAMSLGLDGTLAPQSLEKATRALAGEVAREEDEGVDPNRSITMEVEHSRADGSYAWAEVTVTFLRNDEGRAVGILGVSRDISERKQAEEQTALLETTLAEARKIESLGTLAGGIAHDFNNILMGIQGRASLMLQGLDSRHPYVEHLEGIEDYVEKASDLTKQILGFARAGKYEAKPSDVNALVDKSADLFGRTKKEVKIHKKYQEGVWTVQVDRGQIEQVLLNLYVNAWQAMTGGGDLYVETENVDLDAEFVGPHGLEPGRFVKIAVTDTGIGMDEETRLRVFDPFFTTKEMGRGTGLGLASSHGIIRNHGGMITVSSEKGKGSVFRIYLPAFRSKVTEEIREVQGILEGHETILLVDDEEIIIEVGKRMLDALGYTVITAGSGQEAVELFSDHRGRVDLVILDMVMPDMGGSQTFDRLKSIDSGVRVLLSSGYSLEGQAAKILNRGCRGFIQKPFRIEQLSHKVREVMDADGSPITVS